MPPLTIFRFLSVGITALLIIIFPRRVTYDSILISFSTSHNILALVYSARVIPTNLRQSRFWLFTGLIMCAIAGFALPGNTELRLIFLFWVHHILNEVYLGERHMPAPFLNTGSRIAAMVFHSFLFFALMINDPQLAFLDKRLVAIGLAATTPLYIYLGALRLKNPSASEIFKTFSFELGCAALAVTALLGYLHIRFLDVVFYHYILWAFVPMLSSARRNSSFVLRYGLETMAITLVWLLASPVGLLPYDIHGSWFVQIFFLGAYVHILSSFVLSKAQPDWMNRIFRPGEFSKAPRRTKITTLYSDEG